MGSPRERNAASPNQGESTGIRIMFTNARSIVNKIQELKLYAISASPDIIAITETWTHQNISNQYLQIPDYALVSRHDRQDTENGRGGGILIYVKSSINACETTIPSNFNQHASIDIVSPNSSPISLYVIYRSPNSNATNNDEMVEILKSIRNPVIVVGDFNYPGINWTTLEGNADSQKVIDASLDNFWSQHVSFPTHRSGNILDLVFAEDGLIDEVINDGQLGNSDHCVLMMTTNQSVTPNNQHQKKRDYRRADFNMLRNLFKNCPWTEMMQNTNTTEAWSAFKSTYNSVVDRCIPLKREQSKKWPPWMTHELIHIVTKKRQLWKKYKSDPSDVNHGRFKDAEKMTKKRIRKAKLNFEKKIAKNSKTNSKAFYAYIGGKRSNRSGVGPLQDEQGNIVTDSYHQAEMFNQYYASVFEPENAVMPEPLAQRDAPLLQNAIITREVVKNTIKGLKQYGAPGPDAIANKVLIEACDELCVPLTILFRKSLSEAVVPEDWRSANVSPIHKAGSKKMASNYRPISLTSVVCKIMESILRSTIMSHLCENSLINSTQHGFMNRKSCLTNLLHCLEEVTSVLDDGDSLDILYLDFAKAFDIVQHNRLLSKIKSLNIDGEILQWIEAWLKDRKQRVVLNGVASDWAKVPCSVCQGTVLGPILFTIFINDIDSCLQFIPALILKFADDSKVIKRICSDADTNYLQDIINKLCQWANTWQMRFNVEKCKILHFGNKNPMHNYTMNDVPIQAISSEKDLGIIIQDTAKPSQQCAKAVQKANQVMGQLLRSFQCRDKNTMVQLYKVFVRPHLEYAIQAWCPYMAKDIELLEKVQKRMVRQISGLQGSYENKLKAVGLTTLEERRKRGDCIETFKILNGFTKVDSSTWFTKIERAEGPQTRLSSDPLSLQSKNSRLDLRKNFFSVRVPALWNELPLSVRQSKTINEFKNSYDRSKTNRS